MATCDVIAGRRPRGAAADVLREQYNARAGVTLETGNQRVSDPALELTQGHLATDPPEATQDERDKEGWTRW